MKERSARFGRASFLMWRFLTSEFVAVVSGLTQRSGSLRSEDVGSEDPRGIQVSGRNSLLLTDTL